MSSPVSTFKCPCCQHPLRVHLEDDQVRLFCSHGPCECYEMNGPHGAVGANAQESYDKLVAIYNGWLESVKS